MLKNKFALLVPCYNAENHIENFLENINKLELSFDEIIFYDDASSDRTFEILVNKGYQVIKGTKNMGPGYARNRLAEISNCSWLHFHDIDDGLDPAYLTKTSKIIAKFDYVDVVLCNVDWYDASTQKPILNWHYTNSEININPIKYTIAHPIGGINGLYRRTKFIETGGFNTKIRVWEDADFHVKLAQSKAIFYVVEEVLSYSWRHPKSISSDQSNSWLTRLQLLKEYSLIFFDTDILLQIGLEGQKTASYLILQGNTKEAKSAFELSEFCKVKVPASSSYLWRFFKFLMPPDFRIGIRILQLRLAFRKKL